MEPTEEKEGWTIWNKVAIGIAVMGFFGPILTFIYFFVWPFKESQSLSQLGKLGPLSDWIGGLTIPCFTLASFIVLFLAYRAQKEELQLTRKEMAATRAQFIQQNETLSKQAFESTFFQLLVLHHDIVKNIVHQVNNASFNGRKYFRRAFEEFIGIYSGQRRNSGIVDGQTFNPQTDMKAIIIAYKLFFKEHQDQIGHYFRQLYHIMKFIDDSDLNPEDKYKYARFVRAQLSTYELVLLFYNVMAGHGFFKFRELVIRYDVLQNMNQDIIKHNHYGYLGDVDLWEVLHKQLNSHD
jgi:hypothetical protein